MVDYNINYGNALLSLNRVDEAMRRFVYAVKHEPTSALARYSLAYACCVHEQQPKRLINFAH